MRHLHLYSYLCTFLVFIILGPIVGYFVFYYKITGGSPLHGANIHEVVIDAFQIGMLPAATTGLLFYPAYQTAKRILQRYALPINGPLGFLVGAALGATVLPIWFSKLYFGVFHTTETEKFILMASALLGGMLGYISVKLAAIINKPN